MVATMNSNGMHSKDVIQAWGRILAGYRPNLSIEITKECPLRCPGCYAYGDDHLGGDVTLRGLSDYKGDELVERFMALVERHRPLHISIVGGEPLVRFRELNVLLPRLSEMGIGVQVVTSAVRTIPSAWATINKLTLSVSIDGLQPEHDERRKPATYDRIITNIQGHRINVHCTITRQMMGRPQYFEKFLEFWSARPEVEKIWFSIFTPQVGLQPEENLLSSEREEVLSELLRLRRQFPKAYLPDSVLKGYSNPPQSPADCIFARTTVNFTADLKSRIGPCQFGGQPDCSQCGCFASAGLNAVGRTLLRGGGGRQRIGDTVKTFAEASGGKASPTVGQATGSIAWQSAENAAARFPGPHAPLLTKARDTITAIDKHANQLADNMAFGKSLDPETGGIAAKEGIEFWKDKFNRVGDAAFTRMRRLIPPDTPTMASNTRAALASVTTPDPRAPNITGSLINPKLAQMSEGLDKDILAQVMQGQQGIPVSALFQLRTQVGNKLSDFALVDDIPRSQLKKLYGAITDDMRATAQGNPQALAAFERANTMWAAGMTRVDNFLHGLASKGYEPEKLFRAIELAKLIPDASIEGLAVELRPVMFSDLGEL